MIILNNDETIGEGLPILDVLFVWTFSNNFTPIFYGIYEHAAF